MVDLPYCSPYRSKGRTYVYYRRNGLRQRVHGDIGSPEFLANYVRIHDSFERQPETEIGKAAPGTIAALVLAYRTSAEFKQLSPKSQKDYGRYLDRLSTDLGKGLVRDTRREHIFRYRDRFADKPRTANYIIQVFRLVLEWGKDRGWIDHNPAARPKKLKTGDGHRPWEEFEITAFRDHWALGTVERTAFELMLNTGQRGEDVILTRKNHIERSGDIRVAQEKTKERVTVPQSQLLKDALEAWAEAQEDRACGLLKNDKPVPLDMGRMVLTTITGLRFKIDHFRHVMRDAYDAIPALQEGFGGTKVTTHGLRYTAATILRELDLDWEEIADITGHQTMQMVRKYTKKKRRAKATIERLDSAESKVKKGTEVGVDQQ